MDIVDSVTNSAELVNADLSPFLRENAYQEALKVELSDREIQFTSESVIPVTYRDLPITRMHPDLVVGEDERYILELKVGRDGSDQLRSYLTYAQNIDMGNVVGGLMISFGTDLEIVELDYEDAD